MELRFAAKHTTISDGVRRYAEDKIGRLERYLPVVNTASVEFTLEKTRAAGDRVVIQVTLNCNGHVLRTQHRAAEFQTAIDLAADSLHRQAPRFKAKAQRSALRRPARGAVSQVSEASAPAEDAEAEALLRRKQFAIKDMTPEAAAEEMDLLGHSFYMFKNAKSQVYNVVYRRSAGGYGLIEPQEG
ncbi:MAG: ribosome-associated translation inhibitor RaiA [Dehalococcoidia bacterium]|nr:ribosome-associated translation inhibitor RaiA [Dehalococcoidia bacterium]